MLANNENGNIVVKNPSAFWLPQITVTEDIGGTEFTVHIEYDLVSCIPVDELLKAEPT